MKNNILFTIVFSIVVSNLSIAQTVTMTKSEYETLRLGVIEKSKTTTSIETDFVQLKHLEFLSKDIESSGKLYYKTPDLVKWEYKEPFKYGAIFKDNQLYINDDGSKNNVDLSANNTFQSLNDLIIKSIQGDLFDYNMFEINYTKTLKSFIVRFVPIDATIKALISEVVITFERVTLNVVQVKMYESLEDYTLLNFSNHQFNNPISDEVFTH